MFNFDCITEEDINNIIQIRHELLTIHTEY